MTEENPVTLQDIADAKELHAELINNLNDLGANKDKLVELYKTIKGEMAAADRSIADVESNIRRVEKLIPRLYQLLQTEGNA